MLQHKYEEAKEEFQIFIDSEIESNPEIINELVSSIESLGIEMDENIEGIINELREESVRE